MFLSSRARGSRAGSVGASGAARAFSSSRRMESPSMPAAWSFLAAARARPMVGPSGQPFEIRSLPVTIGLLCLSDLFVRAEQRGADGGHGDEPDGGDGAPV